jgi:phosphoribosylaminoimidazole-succinocarboxamide synthase
VIDIHSLQDEEFRALPLVVEGESKEVRYAGNGLVVIRFKPTIYSFTANRTGIVPGSDVLRLRASRLFIEVLREAGVSHAYRDISDQWVLADLILQPSTEHDPQPFRPADLNSQDIERLPIAPPIEVVLKRMHSGTSKHRYFRMAGHPVRAGHPFFAGKKFAPEGAYPTAIVRFDWRNPFQDPSGKALADEILPDSVADWYIDVPQARSTALKVYDCLSEYLSERDIVCYDLCLFITEDGKTVFGEISQDCGRFRHFDLGELDKDVWRAGGSHELVLQKWQTLLDLCEGVKR